MSAPKGNQFWKLRSKHGRGKLFADASLLWEAAEEYFEWCDKNPWKKKDWVGKDAIEVDRPTQRPYTLAGFCLYCDASREWWTKFKASASEDFLPVITRIEEIIYTQKFEGATVGAFNANIIARDLGLVDKQENKVSGSVETQQVKFDNLSFDQLYVLKYGRRPDES